MAFEARLTSEYFLHLNLLGCLPKKRLTNAVDGHRRTPPPPHLTPAPSKAYYMAVVSLVSELYDYKKTTIQSTPTTYLMAVTAKDLQSKSFSSYQVFKYHCTPFLHNTGCLGGCRFKNIAYIKKDETAKNKFRQSIEK